MHWCTDAKATRPIRLSGPIIYHRLALVKLELHKWWKLCAPPWKSRYSSTVLHTSGWNPWSSLREERRASPRQLLALTANVHLTLHKSSQENMFMLAYRCLIPVIAQQFLVFQQCLFFWYYFIYNSGTPNVTFSSLVFHLQKGLTRGCHLKYLACTWQASKRRESKQVSKWKQLPDNVLVFQVGWNSARPDQPLPWIVCRRGLLRVFWRSHWDLLVALIGIDSAECVWGANSSTSLPNNCGQRRRSN